MLFSEVVLAIADDVVLLLAFPTVLVRFAVHVVLDEERMKIRSLHHRPDDLDPGGLVLEAV